MFRKFALNCAISARKGAPNDGTDPFGTAPNNGYRRSKQNSDASGMFYQWGRKDPFTFATSSVQWGKSSWEYGKYPVKIYNPKSELLYQTDNGNDNTGMTPIGGIIFQSKNASFMMETIQQPNAFYGGNGGSVINQVSHSKELWDYYWTSYSRGTDGKGVWNTASFSSWHNTYLDGYIVLRSKSIYDPCPYGYRTPTNGTYKDINSSSKWIAYSYEGGHIWDNNWFSALGARGPIAIYEYAGAYYWLTMSTIVNSTSQYLLQRSDGNTALRVDMSKSRALSIRCIEDAADNVFLYPVL